MGEILKELLYIYEALESINKKYLQRGDAAVPPTISLSLSLQTLIFCTLSFVQGEDIDLLSLPK